MGSRWPYFLFEDSADAAALPENRRRGDVTAARGLGLSALRPRTSCAAAILPDTLDAQLSLAGGMRSTSPSLLHYPLGPALAGRADFLLAESRRFLVFVALIFWAGTAGACYIGSPPYGPLGYTGVRPLTWIAERANMFLAFCRVSPAARRNPLLRSSTRTLRTGSSSLGALATGPSSP